MRLLRMTTQQWMIAVAVVGLRIGIERTWERLSR
jgi:hypothetical protein